MISEYEKNKIINILENDGIIAFPTDTVWGIGCLPDKPKAIKKIYELKHRTSKKPLILMSSSIDNLIPYIEKLSESAQNLINRFFPGALTIVAKKSVLTQGYVVANGETAGIRVPNHSVFSELAEITRTKVLATTSANISGSKAALTKEEVELYVGSEVDYILDDFGEKPQGIESTVILLDNDEVKVLRQGEIKIG